MYHFRWTRWSTVLCEDWKHTMEKKLCHVTGTIVRIVWTVRERRRVINQPHGHFQLTTLTSMNIARAIFAERGHNYSTLFQDIVRNVIRKKISRILLVHVIMFHVNARPRSTKFNCYNAGQFALGAVAPCPVQSRRNSYLSSFTRNPLGCLCSDEREVARASSAIFDNQPER